MATTEIMYLGTARVIWLTTKICEFLQSFFSEKIIQICMSASPKNWARLRKYYSKITHTEPKKIIPNSSDYEAE